MRHRRIPSTATLFIVIGLLTSCGLQSCTSQTVPATPVPPTAVPTTPVPTTPGTPTSLGQRTKTGGCVSSNGLPDSACTPGAVFSDATADQICTPGYSSKVRNVPSDVKAQAYAEYGIVSHEPGQYEVDHLVALEIGGSNDIANLWPEPADPPPGFHEKDKVEDYLHDQLCSGKMSLQQVQLEIATNWLAVYQHLP